MRKPTRERRQTRRFTIRARLPRLHRGLKLQHQLLLVSLLPLFLLGTAVTLISTTALQRVSLDLVVQRNTALVQVAAAGVNKDLEGYLAPLQTVADRLSQGLTGEEQKAVLRDWAPFLQPFEGGAALLDETGQAIATTPGHEERLGYDYSFRRYFQTARQTLQPVFSAVLQEQPSGQDAVVIATPVLRDGQFGGVLLGVLFLEHHPWIRDLAPLRTPQGSQAYLVDAAGTLIYHPDPAWIGRNIQEYPALQQMVAAGQPQSRLQPSVAMGQDVIASYAPLPGTGWGLLMEEPWHAILAPALPYQWTVGGLLGLGVVMALVALVISVTRTTRPLFGLVQSARLASSGAPFEPLPVEGPAEVRTLILAFNHLVVRLAEQQASLRRYALQVLQGQEDERKRLARELHDETVQELVGLRQRIELCRGALQQDPAAAQHWLDELQQVVTAALAEVRRMSNDLRPHVLEDLGLAAALNVLCEDLARGMPAARVHCEIVGSERRLPAELELTVFRVVQEALTNVRKHARDATRVNVTLYFEEWGILATIEDNGPGFSPVEIPDLVRAGHLGLAGMYERAHLFGGEIKVSSGENEGTSITLRLPGPPRC